MEFGSFCSTYHHHRMVYCLVTLIAWLCTLCATRVHSASPQYSLYQQYVGEEFLDLFRFESIADPTHGRV